MLSQSGSVERLSVREQLAEIEDAIDEAGLA